ncbi:GDSL-type esterase/lipase family protein [Photobacterium atrarenae]|uniref:GDSL-type esterase/lipase family protein n=1 Tax=Photobacterium atrarenae TaxID=865757 RepID=A0ABY5GN47_9GAMM|nr:GDSL-type esterase/lipase family protein [Photobacterium atrarenae]UTV30576.1 GDSL-type esterase/lipase family protein [Photobacterium atrarenae]
MSQNIRPDGQDADTDLITLCHTLQPVSPYLFLDNLFRNLASQNPDLSKALFLSDAYSTLAQLPDTANDAERLTMLCDQLCVKQTAGFISRSLQMTDCHRTFGSQADIVMFGDSITEWGVWSEMFPGIKLANRGLAGDTTRGMLCRIDTTLQLQPKQVFVMAGINDLAQDETVDAVLGRYEEMLGIWQQHAIEPVVQSTLHVGSRLASLNSSVTLLNQRLRQTCRARGIPFIDLNAVLSDRQQLLDEYSRDDLHLNAVAYQKWQQIIEPLLLKSGR